MLYILSGPNKHYKYRFIDSLKSKNSDFTSYSFYAIDPDCVGNIYSILMQVSLFESPKKIVQIIDYDLIPSDIVQKIASEYVSSKDVIIILNSESALRSNSKLLKLVEKKYVINAAEYNSLELLSLVREKLKDSKVQNYEQISKYIIQSVEGSPFALELETDKVINYINMYGKIDEEHLKEIVSKSAMYSIWEYLNSITRGDKNSAVLRIENLLDNGQNEYSILSMILWNIRLITILKLGNDKSDEYIAKSFGYNIFSIRNMRSHIKDFTIEKIKFLYSKTVELDYRIKSGAIDPRLGLILLSYMF